MIGRTNTGGRGGGGGALNFRVIGGTTAPISPKKNDFWVNTNVEVTGYAFTDNEPGIRILKCSTETSSSHIAADGTIVSKVAYGITGYLELPENSKTIIVTCSDVNSTDVYHEFYDENKNSISRVLRHKNVTTYEVPESTAYVRLSRYIVTANSDSDSATVTIDDGITKDGAVWILTGASSAVEFNALKKNGIQVFPISAKQYVSGEWVDKEAKIYQNGEWHELSSRVDYISNGVILKEPTSTYQATIQQSGGICKISPSRNSFQWAVNFECNNHAGQTVYIEIESGYALNSDSYTSGILVNTAEADATDSTPDYVAQTLISNTDKNTVYELKIPADFHSGYLTIHVEPNVSNGYYDIKNLWIE